jgi:hypothetical protein
VVLRARRLYRVLAPGIFEVTLEPDTFGVIEPQVRHEMAPMEELELDVEFHK